MKSAFVVAFCLLFVVASLAHGDGKKKHHHGHEDGHDATCLYKDTQGRTYDLRRLSRTDMIVKDTVTESTFHFNPCGSVHDARCPTGSAVCEINRKGQAISHGAASTARWADGVENHASIEVTYGSGELCSTGAHRKTVVEMRCLHTTDPNTAPSFVNGVTKEDCLLQLVVESALACDRESLCAAITSESICQLNPDLCEVQDGQCVPASCDQFNIHAGVLLLAALAGFCSVVFLCCAFICVCIACKRATQRRTLKRLPTRRPNKKDFAPVPQEDMELTPASTSINAAPTAPEAQGYPYQPFVMMQQADGSFVPVIPYPPHSYSHPMAQFIPAEHPAPATQ